MADPQAARDFATLVQATGVAEGPEQSRAMRYRGGDGRLAGTITVTPLRRRGPASAGPSAVVRVSLPEPEICAQEDVIRRRFGLTPAEWRVAAALYQGQSPQGLAAILGLSVNTVRAQMSRVFAKTGVHRQTELVAAIRAALASPEG